MLMFVHTLINHSLLSIVVSSQDTVVRMSSVYEAMKESCIKKYMSVFHIQQLLNFATITICKIRMNVS